MQQNCPSLQQKRPIASFSVATFSAVMRRIVPVVALIVACEGSSTGPSTDSLVLNLVNQTAETLKVWMDLSFNPGDTVIVLPSHSACVNYGSSLFYPRGVNGESFGSIIVFPQYHLDRWFNEPSWGTKRYPQVALTYSAHHELTWSVGASPCAPPPTTTPSLSSVTARIHLATAPTAYADSCAVNTAYKTLPDTLLTGLSLYNADYDSSTKTSYSRVLDSEQGFRDSTAVIGLKAHIVVRDTLFLTWYVGFPGADSSFGYWQEQFRMVCGSSYPP